MLHRNTTEPLPWDVWWVNTILAIELVLLLIMRLMVWIDDRLALIRNAAGRMGEHETVGLPGWLHHPENR